jgi:hypothetical protein
MPEFESILYLDDMRVPTVYGIDLVRSYDEFVWYLQNKPMPELISFDHDLADAHYPGEKNEAGVMIDYDAYTEKTGLHCARFIIENGLRLKYWVVHSFNVQGKINIETELREYRPHLEMRGLQIPYRIPSTTHG